MNDGGAAVPALGMLAATALAGGVGAVCRLLVSSAVGSRFGSELPLGTIVVNISGSLLLGLLAGAVAATSLPHDWLLVAGTGFLGGYTTFSAASFETVRLALDGHWRHALTNALGVAFLAVAAAAAGFTLGAAL